MAKLVDIIVPEDQQEGTQSVVANWLKKPGDSVQENEPIVELSTDKAMVEIAAPTSGVLREIIVPLDDPAIPGCVLGRIEEGAKETSTKKSETQEGQLETVPSFRPEVLPEGLRASPAVKRLAQKYGVSLVDLTGTGRAGRITKRDILPLLPDRAVTTLGTQNRSNVVLPEIQAESRFVPHDFMRRTIAKRMTHSLLEVAPHVTSVFECDLFGVQRHREQNKERLEKEKINLSYTVYFVWACVKGIQASPEVNSRWHSDKLEIFEDINIGVGTALGEKGLVVPVIKRAQTLSFRQLAENLTSMTHKAREGTLSAEEMADGTFTISNHGVSGSLFAAPIIIQQPQSAILGLGKLEDRAVVVEKESGEKSIEIRPRLYVSLTIDHRALDAYHTNRFLSTFVNSLEKLASAPPEI